MMLKNGLARVTTIKIIKDFFQQEKIKKYQVFLKKIITEFVALRPKVYAYLDNYGSNPKKAKGTKKCAIKQKLMFQNLKDCLFNNKNIYRSQQRLDVYTEEVCNHDVYTEEINKIALRNNDDKRLQTFDRITIYIHMEQMLLKYVKVKCF